MKGDVSVNRVKSKQTPNYFKQSTEICSIEGIDCIHFGGRESKLSEDRARECMIEELALNLA